MSEKWKKSCLLSSVENFQINASTSFKWDCLSLSHRRLFTAKCIGSFLFFPSILSSVHKQLTWLCRCRNLQEFIFSAFSVTTDFQWQDFQGLPLIVIACCRYLFENQKKLRGHRWSEQPSWRKKRKTKKFCLKN